MRYLCRRSFPGFRRRLPLSGALAGDSSGFLEDLRCLLESHLARKRVAEAQWPLDVLP